MPTMAPPEPVTRVWTADQIVAALKKSRRAMERALLALYDRQSPAERALEDTPVTDGIGFNRFDKPFLSSLCEQIVASRHPEGYRLTDKQLAAALPKLTRYAGQLADIANRNERVAAVEARVGHRPVDCGVCRNTRVVVRMFLGQPVTEACPACGESPYREE